MAKAKGKKRDDRTGIQTDDEGREFPKDQHAGERDDNDGYVDPSRPDQLVNRPEDPTNAIEVEILDTSGEQAEVIDRSGKGGDEEEDRDTRETREQREEARGRRRAAREDRDDDDGDYSEKVRRRINRERALRRKSDERSDEIAAENVRLRERLKLARKEDVTAQETTLAAKKEQIKTITTQLEAAIEAGNTKEQLDLTIKLGELQADIKLMERDIATAKEAQAGVEEETEARTDGPAPEAVKAATKWARVNRSWWNLSAFKDAQKDTMTLDRQILAEIKDGDLDIEPYSDEHMDELAHRLKAAYPDLDIRNLDDERVDLDGDGDDDEDRDMRDDDDELERGSRRQNGRREVERNGRNGNGRGRAPQGGIGGRGGRGRPDPVALARQGKVQLGREDYAQMRQYGLDPNDKKVRERFAKERMRTILTDAQRGGR